MVIYDRYDVVFQEVPNEVSLAFTLKGCPNNCVGCHSAHLRELTGEELSVDLLESLLTKYKSKVTCILFLGGDRWHKEIAKLCDFIRSKGFKTAMYSGNDEANGELVAHLDYYKIGSYNHELGGLTSKNTNQKLYKIVDITKEFQNGF